MNPLNQYLSVRNKLRPGDVVVFWGNARNPLSGLIELFTSGGPSHTAIVRQPAIEGMDVMITQSTLDRAGNGVRTNPLSETLASYLSGSAAALLLNDGTRSRIDWQKFYAYIGSIDHIVKYNVAELFAFLLPEALDRGQPQAKRVCSVTVGSILAACGAISHVNWGELRPQSIVELGIYSTWLPLIGKPQPKNFNTI